MNATQRSVLTVLARITVEVNNDQDIAEMWSDSLEQTLNEMAVNDCFGTEQQADPRGDFREGKWTMRRLQSDMARGRG